MRRLRKMSAIKGVKKVGKKSLPVSKDKVPNGISVNGVTNGSHNNSHNGMTNGITGVGSNQLMTLDAICLSEDFDIVFEPDESMDDAKVVVKELIKEHKEQKENVKSMSRENNLAITQEDVDKILLDAHLSMEEEIEEEHVLSKEQKKSVKPKSSAKPVTKVTKKPTVITKKSVKEPLPAIEDYSEEEEAPNSPISYSGSNDNSSEHSDASDNDNSDEEKKTKKPRTKKVVKKPDGVKKGPGRPRKIPKKDPIPRKGIQKQMNKDSHIEFLYDSPVFLKKLVIFFKQLATMNIQILFRPADIIMFGIDHYGKSRVRVRIDASKLNHYYCKSILDVGVSCKELELILNKIDKEYTSIVLMSTIGDTQKNLTLILDNDIKINEEHVIDLVGQYNHMDREEEFINEDYMIKFEWPGKYFRKTINDIKPMSKQLAIIQEDYQSNLSFQYSTSNKKVHSKHDVRDPKKIKLRSNLTDDMNFRVEIKIDYIKPISSAQIADDIEIFVDEKK
jgi:hypothetical protein